MIYCFNHLNDVLHAKQTTLLSIKIDSYPYLLHPLKSEIKESVFRNICLSAEQQSKLLFFSELDAFSNLKTN